MVPKNSGQKIKPKWGDIRAKMRHNLTAIAWNDKWNVHILTKMHSPPLKGNFFDKHEKL
jgi:hypothetical protein